MQPTEQRPPVSRRRWGIFGVVALVGAGLIVGTGIRAREEQDNRLKEWTDDQAILFAERKYVIFSLYVQLAGVVLFLIPYFILKFYLPSYNGPMISFLHRLILNPTLLMLLIPAFYYQRRLERDGVRNTE